MASKHGDVAVGYADTNVFIALLAGPSHGLHERALGLFRRVAEGQLSLIVTPVIVAELVYSVKDVLRWSRSETAARLAAVLDADGLLVRDLSVVQSALHLYGQHPRLAFADAYLAAAASVTGPAIVVSFDRDFDVLEDLARIAA
jgi:predicted nucleic acid-binding protein